MPVYDEAAYENALIDLFTNTLGYTHVYGSDIDRDWHSPLYDSVLEDSIRRLNPKASPAARKVREIWTRMSSSMSLKSLLTSL